MPIKIPSRIECYKIIHDMKMLDHIVAHSLQVCRVALLLVDLLKNRGAILNRELVQASALLHDITKTRSIKTHENHALTGSELIHGLGYPEIAEIIGQHVRLNNYSLLTKPQEVEIVNYADKRVLHDKVVSLPERMEYILERYGTTDEQRQNIHWGWHKTEELEYKVFTTLALDPEQLTLLITPPDCTADFEFYQKACTSI